MNLAAAATGAGWIVLAMAVCGAVYALGATLALWRFTRKPAPTLAGAPSVTVLKPVLGDEPGLYENLKSFCAQDYPGPVQLIIGAQDPADAALAVAERVRREHPCVDMAIVSDGTPHGTNRKIANLINMSAQAVGEIVVISDSDVRLAPNGLTRIVAALQQPGVGLIHCLYRGVPVGNLWSDLAAMDNQIRFAPSVVIGEALGANPCLGPTMALRAEVLQKLGGFQFLADQLADDFVLGIGVRGQGLSIASPALIIDHLFPEKTAREMLVHELRWARTIRLVQPAGYGGSVITHFLVLALIGAALTGFALLPLQILLGLLVLRMIQCVVLVRLMKADGGKLWLAPLRDLLSFGVFLAAYTGNRIEWRGNRLRVGSDGAMASS